MTVFCRSCHGIVCLVRMICPVWTRRMNLHAQARGEHGSSSTQGLNRRPPTRQPEVLTTHMRIQCWKKERPVSYVGDTYDLELLSLGIIELQHPPLRSRCFRDMPRKIARE